MQFLETCSYFVLLIKSNQSMVLWSLAVFYISSSFEKWSSKTKINSQSSVNLSRILSILEVAETSYFWCLIPSEDSKIASFCQLHHRRELIIGFRKPLSTSWLKANIWIHLHTLFTTLSSSCLKTLFKIFDLLSSFSPFSLFNSFDHIFFHLSLLMSEDFHIF